jgi:hypothetical protein
MAFIPLRVQYAKQNNCKVVLTYAVDGQELKDTIQVDYWRDAGKAIAEAYEGDFVCKTQSPDSWGDDDLIIIQTNLNDESLT